MINKVVMDNLFEDYLTIFINLIAFLN